MAEFVIDDFEYKTGRLPAFSQFHIIQKFGPAAGPFVRQMMPAIDLYKETGLKGLATAVMAADTKVDEISPEYREIVLKGIDALGQALGSLTDEASEYVMGECLSVAERRPKGSNGMWAELWNKGTKSPQFHDMKLAHMLRITWFVMRENMGDFFRDLSFLSKDE